MGSAVRRISATEVEIKRFVSDMSWERESKESKKGETAGFGVGERSAVTALMTVDPGS